MVLDEASVSQDTPFTESAPSSDLDPYASSGAEYPTTKDGSYLLVTPPGPGAIYVNLDNVPRRFSLIGERQHPKPLLAAIVESCRLASETMHRQVTQEEADAFAQHVGKTIALTSYGSPVGVALASIQFYRTQKDYRFPGWTPMKEGSRFSPDVFGPLRGSLARTAWNITRLSAYWMVGTIAGQLFFGSYALSLGVSDRYRDPRLNDVRESFKRRLQEQKGGVPTADSGGNQAETFEMLRQRQAAQHASRQRTQRNSGQNIDDMSPTGGSFMDDFTSESTDGENMSFQTRDQNFQQDIGGTWARPATTPVKSPSSQQQMDAKSQQVQRSSSSYPLDTAFQSGESPEQAKPVGSTWDRLRKNAMSGQTVQQTNRQLGPQNKPTAAQGESFSFSQLEEDRQLAKIEAQKQFDARLERERHGKDFEDSNKRWN